MSEPDVWDPGSPENRERTQETKRQMRRLPMEWDPIGVTGIPEAADEYDCMISPLLHLLFEGADIRSLVAGSATSGHLISASGLTKPRTCGWPSRWPRGGRGDESKRPYCPGTRSGRWGDQSGYVSDTISVAMPRGFAADYAHFE